MITPVLRDRHVNGATLARHGFTLAAGSQGLRDGLSCFLTQSTGEEAVEGDAIEMVAREIVTRERGCGGKALRRDRT
jgi:hypothetical protein